MWQDPPEDDGTGSLMRALQKILAGGPLRDAPPPVRSQVPPPIVPGQVGPLRPVPSQNPWARDVEKFDTRVTGLVDPGFSAPSSATPAIPPAAPKARPSRPRSPRPLQQALSRGRTSPIAPNALPEQEYADLPTSGILQDDDVAKVLASAPKPAVPEIGPQGSSTLEIPASNKVERGGWKGTLMHALKGALAGASQGLKYSDGDLRGALGGAITGSVGSAINPTRGAEYFQEQIEQPRQDAQTARENALKMGSLELALKQAQAQTAGYGPKKAQTDIALDEERIQSERENRAYSQSERSARAEAARAQAKRDEWIAIPGTGVLRNIITGEEVRAPYGRSQDGRPISQAEAEMEEQDTEGAVEDIARDSVAGNPTGWRQYVTPEILKILDDPMSAEKEDPKTVIAAEKAKLAAQEKQYKEALRYTQNVRKQKSRQRRFGGGSVSGAVRSAGTLRWD